MCNVEPQSCAQRVFFVFRAEHSLRNVSASAGLGAWIPSQPPLHSEIHNESEHRERPDGVARPAQMEIGEECSWVGSGSARCLCVRANNLQMRFEHVHAANL